MNFFRSLLAVILLPSATALAQATEADAGAAAEPLPIERAPVAAAPEAVSSDDESIYVVQRRAYSKSGRFELTPSFFASLNNKFVGHIGGTLSATYHVRENFAVELSTALPYVVSGYYSGLVVEVRNGTPPLSPEVVDLKQMRYFGTASLQFSALYGKLDFFSYLVDYDFYVTAGAGVAKTVETCIPASSASGDPDCSEEVDDIGYGLKTPVDGADAWKFAGSLGGGMRIFFSDHLGLRLEVRDLVYADRAAEGNEVTTDIRNNVLFFGGLSILL